MSIERRVAIQLLDDEILKRYEAGALPDLREAALSVIEEVLTTETIILETDPEDTEGVRNFSKYLVRQAKKEYKQGSGFHRWIEAKTEEILSDEN